MIRRRVEYIITCDCKRIFGYARCDGNATAFNSDTMADCVAEAQNHKWLKVSKRLWLSPSCRVSYEWQKAQLTDSQKEAKQQ